jgi:hypothetical protein
MEEKKRNKKKKWEEMLYLTIYKEFGSEAFVNGRKEEE